MNGWQEHPVIEYSCVNNAHSIDALPGIEPDLYPYRMPVQIGLRNQGREVGVPVGGDDY